MRPSLLLKPDHGRAGNVAGQKEGSGQPRRQREGLQQLHRRESVEQAGGRHLVEERQLAFLLQPHLHDAACVLVQHARQLDRHRRGVDGHVRVTLRDQLQRAGVVRVGMGDQDGVDAAAALDLLEVRQLVAGQAPACLGRGADAGIDQQPAPADLDQDAAGADLVGAAQKGNVHGADRRMDGRRCANYPMFTHRRKRRGRTRRTPTPVTGGCIHTSQTAA